MKNTTPCTKRTNNLLRNVSNNLSIWMLKHILCF